MTELVLGVDGKFILVDGSFITPPSLDGGLQSKNVTPTVEEQIVTADKPYVGLSQVTVGAVPTEEKIVIPSESQQIVIPTSGKFLSKVTVNGIYAIIGVTYPEGSICTCSSGTKTLTARDTSGKALFNVPSAGTWTVSCTDGEKTKSKTVEITADGQVVIIELSYDLFLYSKGNTHTENGGDWTTTGYSRAGWTGFENVPPSNTDSGLSVSNGTQISVFGKEQKIDFTDYSKLVFNVVELNADQPQCFITNNKEWMEESNSVANIRFDKQTGEITLDISSISGFYYIAFAFYNGTCLIEEVKLT